ncbi:MAG: hypothetical protein ACYC3H_11675 [Bellilinea sp.]
MKSKITQLLAIALFALLMGGCNLSDRITASALSEIDPGSVIYFDNFSNPESGWEVWDSDRAAISYYADGIRFLIKEANYDYWSLPGQRFTDVTLGVDARLLAGPTDNDFGLLCRFQNEYNFYAFLISSDGYGGIIKVKDGLYQTLNSPDGLEFGPMIEQGDAANQIRADCIGTRLTLYVNQEKFLDVEDADFSTGDVGLIAGSYNEPGVDILFDNFYVLKP